MTFPYLHDGLPYFSYDCYTWCHPEEVDFGDYLNLDYLVHDRKHHLVPFYVRAMYSLATALGICPAYLPRASMSSPSAPSQNATVDDAITYYAVHLQCLLHPPNHAMFAHDEVGAIFGDLLPLRRNLVEVIYATNWRGEGGNNAPHYFENWRNLGFAAACESIICQYLPTLKRSVVPQIERIDRTLFQGLFPDLSWQTVSLSELQSVWGYPDPNDQNEWD